MITPKKRPNGEAEEERGMYLADRIGSRHHICLETYWVNKKPVGLNLHRIPGIHPEYLALYPAFGQDSGQKY